MFSTNGGWSNFFSGPKEWVPLIGNQRRERRWPGRRRTSVVCLLQARISPRSCRLNYCGERHTKLWWTVYSPCWPFLQLNKNILKSRAQIAIIPINKSIDHSNQSINPSFQSVNQTYFLCPWASRAHFFPRVQPFAISTDWSRQCENLRSRSQPRAGLFDGVVITWNEDKSTQLLRTQPTSLSINQSFSQSTNQPINRSIDSLLIPQLINQSTLTLGLSFIRLSKSNKHEFIGPIRTDNFGHNKNIIQFLFVNTPVHSDGTCQGIGK